MLETFKMGEKVRVIAGPFAGRIGIVSSVPKGKTSNIFVNIVPFVVQWLPKRDLRHMWEIDTVQTAAETIAALEKRVAELEAENAALKRTAAKEG